MNSIFKVLRIILGLVFIYASFAKILDPMAFAGIINNYQILPDSMISIVALILPWVEFLCGVLLLTGVMVKASSLMLSILLIVFMIALSYAGAKGIDIACGCFSNNPESTENITQLLVRDAVFLIMSVVLFIYSVKKHL